MTADSKVLALADHLDHVAATAGPRSWSDVATMLRQAAAEDAAELARLGLIVVAIDDVKSLDAVAWSEGWHAGRRESEKVQSAELERLPALLSDRIAEAERDEQEDKDAGDYWNAKEHRGAANAFRHARYEVVKALHGLRAALADDGADHE